MENEQVKVDYSNGKGKNGSRFAFVRPAEKCANRSRRFRVEGLEAGIEAYFSEVKYYLVGGLKIGAKNESMALREYWRVCEKAQFGVAQNIVPV